MNTDEQTSQDPVHLCVFIHGLWGNPGHLKNVVATLRDRFSEKELHILVAKRNVGNFTYDGIEVGGERVTKEIEDEIVQIEENGRTVEKLSIVGYSLGGLVARYAIGLLLSKNWFDRIQPVNFTTFASPHIGVRTPLIGWHSHVWNGLVSKTLSSSGQQMFLDDKFRDTDRPLLALLADPKSIFIKALSKFQHRSLYANAVNDRSVPFYTAYISRIDPFTNLDGINIEYEPGYGEVVLKGMPTPKTEELSCYESFASTGRAVISKAPFFMVVGALLPVVSVGYLINSGIQSYNSARRIKEHQEGKADTKPDAYRAPLLVDIQRRVEHAIEGAHGYQQEEFYDDEMAAALDRTLSKTPPIAKEEQRDDQPSSDTEQSNGTADSKSQALIPAKDRPHGFPTLALTPEQFQMIDALDEVGFAKFAVYIHKVNHTHAGIIVRMKRPGFDEGYVVLKHWAERFKI